VSRASRVAGWAYLLAIAVIVAAQYGIYARLAVPGDPAATARNFLAHATLLRLDAVCAFAYAFGLVVFLSALHVVLSPVSRGLALAAALLRLVSAFTWVGIGVVLLAALRLGEREGMARPLLGTSADLYYAGLPFYAASATLCAWLWLRSRLLPWGLAVAGVVASAWCLVSTVIYLVLPPFGRAVNLYTLDTPMALYEMATGVWLVADLRDRRLRRPWP